MVNSLKEQSLSLTFRQVKLLFTGTPRVGKSTLKKRIMKEITNLSVEPETNVSTGLEKPCVVQVSLNDSKAEQAAFMISHSSKESSHTWKNQKLEKQFSTLFDSMLGRKVNPLNFEDGDKATSPQISVALNQTTEKGMESIPSLPVSSPFLPPVPSPSSPPVPSPSATSLPSQSSPLVIPPSSQSSLLPSLVRDIASVARQINWQEKKEQLALVEETTNVYIMDTGGQPEFHEVLPFVLQGRAVHLILFSLLEDKDGVDCLDRQFEVDYFSEETSTDPYNSVYPVKDVLFQLLASFHSLYKSEICNQRVSNLDLNSCVCSPQAILVGTYKDKFFEGKDLSQQKQCLDQVNQKLITTFKRSDFYEKSFLSTVPQELQCAGDSTNAGDRYYVAMDNMNGTMEEMEIFRHFLTKKIFQITKAIELPCSVLLFHLPFFQINAVSRMHIVMHAASRGILLLCASLPTVENPGSRYVKSIVKRLR